MISDTSFRKYPQNENFRLDNLNLNILVLLKTKTNKKNTIKMTKIEDLPEKRG